MNYLIRTLNMQTIQYNSCVINQLGHISTNSFILFSMHAQSEKALPYSFTFNNPNSLVKLAALSAASLGTCSVC